MAFNIMDLFGAEALNRLLQPAQQQAAQNFLANPAQAQQQPMAPPLPPPTTIGPAPQVAQNDPWQGMREGDVMARQMPQAAPQQAQQTQQGGMAGLGIDKQFLNDFFIGMAMGQDPGQSLALGAAQASKGKSSRSGVNETVNWLKSKGMDEAQAKIVASNPQTLQDVLTQMMSPQQQAKPIEINGKLVDPNTYQVIADYSTPKEAVDGRTATMKELEAAGLKPGTPDYEQALLANNRPKGMMMEVDGQGGVRLVQGADVSGGANLNVEQGKNTGFLIRAQDANKEITNLESQGTSAWNKVAGSIPGVGNYLVGEDAQKLTQAKRDFINSVLRQESGAVISPEEFANAEQQYFPQPGDGPEVIAQKRKNRDNAIAGFRIRSGPGAQSVDQMQGTTPAPQAGGVVDYQTYFGGQ